MNRARFSVIVPAFNEAAGIAETVARCKAVCGPGDEVVVVDDGSRDETVARARAAGARVVRLPKNRGKATALRIGFAHARNEVVVTIDADRTYPPEAIPGMVRLLRRADLVVGSRFLGRWPAALAWHRVAANKLGALFASLLLGARITDVTTGLRAFRKSLLEEMPTITARGLDFEAEFTARAIREGKRYREVAVQPEAREGQSTLRFFRHLWLFFLAVLRGRFG